jgi:hypothetical protein
LVIVFAVSRSTGISEKAAAHRRTSTPKAFASPHVARRDDIEQELAVAHERDFIGDVAMLQGTSTLATARVTSDEAEILYVPADELRRVLAGLPRDSKPIVDALIMKLR